MKNITQSEYAAFQTAYDFFNSELFEGQLPQVMITLNRKNKSFGYFSPERFTDRKEFHDGADIIAHEIALNPDCFGRTDKDILSTLVHEMVHAWQQCFGKVPRRAYHDKQWASKMIEVGLYPSSTGEPGGKTTGQNMTHYVVNGGRFEQSFLKLQRTNFTLNWQSRSDIGGILKKKAKSKTKYTCASCDLNVWGKPGIKIRCEDCDWLLTTENSEDES